MLGDLRGPWPHDDQTGSPASLSSTLRTLSSILCGRSIRVPNRSVDEIRGAPIACTTSWQRLMAANTTSHSPSMLVPYACSLVFRPASASTRSHAAISLETDTPTPIGIKHRSAITRIITFQSYCPSIVRFVPTAAPIFFEPFTSPLVGRDCHRLGREVRNQRWCKHFPTGS